MLPHPISERRTSAPRDHHLFVFTLRLERARRLGPPSSAWQARGRAQLRKRRSRAYSPGAQMNGHLHLHLLELVTNCENQHSRASGRGRSRLFRVSAGKWRHNKSQRVRHCRQLIIRLGLARRPCVGAGAIGAADTQRMLLLSVVALRAPGEASRSVATNAARRMAALAAPAARAESWPRAGRSPVRVAVASRAMCYVSNWPASLGWPSDSAETRAAANLSRSDE